METVVGGIETRGTGSDIIACGTIPELGAAAGIFIVCADGAVDSSIGAGERILAGIVGVGARGDGRGRATLKVGVGNVLVATGGRTEGKAWAF